MTQMTINSTYNKDLKQLLSEALYKITLRIIKIKSIKNFVIELFIKGI